MKKILKRILPILLGGMIIASMSLAFSACKKKPDISELTVYYDNVSYRRQVDSDIGYYYAAGCIEEYNKSDEPNIAQFIMSEINGLPVLELGYSIFMNNAGLYHSSSTLEKLYLPSTIIYMNAQYFSRRDGSLGDDIS